MISVTDPQRRRQLELLGLTEDDLRIVRRHREEILEAARMVTEALPALIKKYPETRQIMEGYSIEKHRTDVGKHIASLADGVIDDAYIHKRIRVGETHNDVNVAPHLYMSGFQLAFTAFVDVLERTKAYTDQQMAEIVRAFGRVFNLDMQLILEAYVDSYEATIKHLAYYDALTGFPNRELFLDRMQAAIDRATRGGGKGAVLFINLDRFKIVNDTYGRPAGDRMLTETAEKISRVIRTGDTLARVGGDEFAVLVTDVENEGEPARVAHRIGQAMEQPFNLGEGEMTITPSIGIALFPDDGRIPDQLLERAEVAMFQAKQTRTAYHFYTPGMHEQVSKRLDTELALRHALERGELTIHYQPQFELPTRRLVGFEALLRWHRDGTTWVGPDEFIPLAEETRLIIPIGEWVLTTALRQLKKWHVMGFPWLTMSVNVSPVQLQPTVTDRVRRILDDVGIEPRFLELEITENVTLQYADDGLQILHALKQLGIGIAIDDFGTGYSSLGYLQDLPIDTLKIDRSFIMGMTDKPQARGIVETVVTLARNFQLRTTAEGVETHDQLQLLQQLGCHRVQGFLLGKPMAVADAERKFVLAMMH